MCDVWQVVRGIKVYVIGGKHISSSVKVQGSEHDLSGEHKHLGRTRRDTPIVGDGKSGTKDE